MAKVNLEKMSRAELEDLEARLAAAKVSREESEKQALREEIYELIDSHGYTFGEIFGKAKLRKVGTVKPKYRNPQDPTETWTGRGRRPRWLEAQIKKGKSLNSFLIS